MSRCKSSRSVSLWIVAFFLLSLSACGGGSDGPGSTPGGGGNGTGGGGAPTSFDPFFTGPDQNGVITFESVTPAKYSDLVKGRAGLPTVNVTGTLYMPPGVTGPVPVMVMSHGSSGIQNDLSFYEKKARMFNDMGVAAFLIDSQTPRGLSGQTTGSTGANVADALIAMVILSRLPQIDADRIGHVGYSLGGLVSFNTLFDETQAVIAPETQRFKVHIGYYPQCNIRQWSPNVSKAPVLVLHGELDEWDDYKACINMVDSLNAVNANASIVTYPGAHHGYDFGVPLVFNTTAIVPYKCAGETRLDTFQKRRFDNGQIFASNAEYKTYLDGCKSTGANFGGDDAAALAATADTALQVRNLLTTVFGL